ncbi:MAG: rod shape-determining protein MreD [Planctomycetes bacterium]|nr:rod shape-determining protein MreD [Planctomycetota bacterium]
MKPPLVLLLLASVAFQVLAGPLYEVELAGRGPFAPDFVLVTLACARLLRGPGPWLLAAAALGLVADALSLDPWGAHAAAYAAAAWVAGLAARAGAASWPPRALALLLAAASGGAARAGAMWAWRQDSAMPGLESVAGSAVWEAALGLVVLALLDAARGTVPRSCRGAVPRSCRGAVPRSCRGAVPRSCRGAVPRSCPGRLVAPARGEVPRSRPVDLRSR